MNTEKKDAKRKQLFDFIIDQHIIGNWDVTELAVTRLSKIELIRLTVYLCHYYPSYYIDVTGSKKFNIYDMPK
jgi:hypothetical protein